MTRYIVLSKKMAGFICYGFNRDGYLIEFRNCTWDYSDAQIRGVLEQLSHALTYTRFENWVTANELEVMQIETDLSFDTWYHVFDMARDRKDAKDIWMRFEKAAKQERFSADLRLRAHWITEAYDRYLKRFKLDYKMYPKTFLSAHLEDEFDKLKEPKK